VELFDFISVAVSIVLGISAAHLLSGLRDESGQLIIRVHNETLSVRRDVRLQRRSFDR
jgi:hypothetical protein